MANSCRKHVKCFICKTKLCNENRLEAHYRQYHPISMNERVVPNRILPPAGFPHSVISWFEYSRSTWVVIEKLSIKDLLIDNFVFASPPEDTPNKEPISPQQPDLDCTSNPTKTTTLTPAVGVEYAGGKAYGKATGLYNKHRKYSEQWNPRHPFGSAHDFQQAQLFSQQMKSWID